MKNSPVVLQTGFRIFFLGAAFYAVLSVAAWMCFYAFGWNIQTAMPMAIWHGHEMIYGYSMAVVAGFLLTAVMNWTGLKTLEGGPLLLLFLFWAVARVLSFFPGQTPGILMAVCDNIFLLYLLIAIARPIFKVKQWRQWVILSMLALILTSNIFFYLGLFNIFMPGIRVGLYFATYMIVGLIFAIAGRVIPFFVEKGVGYSVTLRRPKNLDTAGLICLILFALLDTFSPESWVILFLSVSLIVIHIVRLAGWYTPGIWKKPLLWILFAGYSFLIMGFVLKFFSYVAKISPFYALHAFTYGGIGLFSLGMMARVSLGHTGRNIHEAPPVVSFIFGILIAGACTRIFFPIFDVAHYRLWIGIAQSLWMAAFAVFLYVYFFILISKRPDGKVG